MRITSIPINHKVFISHSNRYIETAKYFGEFLKSRGLVPIIIELIPNAGKLWTIAEKIKHFKKECDTAVIVATPDEIQDGRPVPRMDVTFEMGFFGNKKSIILKERSTTLPKSLDPIYIAFDLEDLSGCLDELDSELESIFGKDVLDKKPFAKEPPRRETEPYILDGRRLFLEQPSTIEEEVQCIFLEKSKEEQLGIVRSIVNLLDNENGNIREISGRMIEEILMFDPFLVPREAIVKMSQDGSFSVRSSAAVCLFMLANMAPYLVPLDIVIRLASPDEDWYVSTPAFATLKTLAHENPRALEVILRMALSDVEDESEIGVSALLDVIHNDPEILDEENLRLLEKSSSKYAQKVIAEISTALERGMQGPGIIHYSPF